MANTLTRWRRKRYIIAFAYFKFLNVGRSWKLTGIWCSLHQLPLKVYLPCDCFIYNKKGIPYEYINQKLSNCKIKAEILNFIIFFTILLGPCFSSFFAYGSLHVINSIYRLNVSRRWPKGTRIGSGQGPNTTVLYEDIFTPYLANWSLNTRAQTIGEKYYHRTLQ